VIRNNLSTRPFYNVAAVRLWLTVIAAIVLAATVFNVSQVLRYSNSNTELASRAASDEARAADLRARAQRTRASIDVAQVTSVSADARTANDLIDRRTFSWTELFNRFEKTLPDDVRITSVHPTVDRERRIQLTVNVLARGVEDVNQFMENLDATGAFADLHSRQEQTNEDGQIESVLGMIYLTRPSADAQPGTVAPAAGGAASGGGAADAAPAAAPGGAR
jgi:Tfp pilus assembly protein PilN